jgi:hypothetical protein
MFVLAVVAWALCSGFLIARFFLAGSASDSFDYPRVALVIFGALLVGFAISLPFLMGCNYTGCTTQGDLENVWARLYELSPGLTTTLQVFIGATATCGGTIALLAFVTSNKKEPTVSSILRDIENSVRVELEVAESEEQVLKSAFPDGIKRAIKKEMKDFSTAVTSGDVSREVEANAKALFALLGRIDSLKLNGTKLEKSVAPRLEKQVLEGIAAFQQEIWNGDLASSLHFEMDLGDAELDFGFFKDDAKFGKYSRQSLDTYANFGYDDPIQVRGERLVIGFNVYQVTSKTKVKVRQYLDEDQVEVIEIRIRGNHWVLDLEAYGFEAFEPTTAEEQQELDDWSEYKSQLNSFVSAIEQVRGALELVAVQKKNADKKEELKNKHSGVKFGNWIGVRPLGNGGFGQVWLAEKKARGLDTPIQQAAIKIFSQSDFQSLKQFQAEIASLGQMHHPNIAQLIDNAKTGNVFWFATNYVGEVSMGSIVSSGRVVPQKSLQTYATQLFAALAHAHRRHIVHGDVHPGNLVLTNDQSAIVLVDFGLSVIGGHRTQETLTHVEYRAPELLSDQPLVDPKNDVYSAAVTILTLARGCSPWKSSDVKELMREIKRGAPSLVGLDESLAKFLAPLLTVNPAKRPSSEDIFMHLNDGGFHAWPPHRNVG